MFKELSPWFENKDWDWSALYKHGIEKTVEPDEMIYSIGQSASDVYIVKEGRVRLYHTSHDGREKALIIMCEGTIAGDSSLNEKYFESAIAVSKTSYIKINRKIFASVLGESESLLQQYTDFLNRKVQTLSLLNLLGAYYDSETRIRYAMFHLANQFGMPVENNSTKIFMQFTQQELADLVGTSRVTVANMVNLIIHKGLIEKEGRFYIIPSIEKILPNE